MVVVTLVVALVHLDGMTSIYPGNISTSTRSSTTKLVILTFGDTLKGQITTAKPILDKYGFKGSLLLHVTG